MAGVYLKAYKGILPEGTCLWVNRAVNYYASAR